MTTPQHYALWARLADPKCKICRGLGYAYFRRKEQISVGEMSMRNILPTTETYKTCCDCVRKDTQ